MNAFSVMSPADLLVAAGYEHGKRVCADSAARHIFDALGEEVAQLKMWEVPGWLASRGELMGPWTPWQAEMVRRYEALSEPSYPEPDAPETIEAVFLECTLRRAPLPGGVWVSDERDGRYFALRYRPWAAVPEEVYVCEEHRGGRLYAAGHGPTYGAALEQLDYRRRQLPRLRRLWAAVARHQLSQGAPSVSPRPMTGSAA